MKKHNKKSGQGLVEYALIISLIALAALFSMTSLGKKITVDMYGLVNGGISNAEERITAGSAEGGSSTGETTPSGS